MVVLVVTLEEQPKRDCDLENLKVTGSHVHFKSGIVLKTVLDKDVEQQSTNSK